MPKGSIGAAGRSSGDPEPSMIFRLRQFRQPVTVACGKLDTTADGAKIAHAMRLDRDDDSLRILDSFEKAGNRGGWRQGLVGGIGAIAEAQGRQGRSRSI
jgi:hypothetical protein